MEQKTFLRYVAMVLRRAIRNAWERLGAFGTLLGLGVSVLVAYLAEKPKSLADFGVSEAVMAAEIFLVLFIIAMVIYIVKEPVVIYNEQAVKIDNLASELAMIKNGRPNLKVGRVWMDKRQLPISAGVFTPNFYHVAFSNQLATPTPDATATNVYAQLTYYDEAKKKLIGPIRGRWGDSPMDLPSVTLEASGVPHGLDIAIHYPGEETIYAFNIESVTNSGWKRPEFVIDQKKIFVQIQVTADQMRVPDSWVLIEIDKNPPISLLPKAPF